METASLYRALLIALLGVSLVACGEAEEDGEPTRALATCNDDACLEQSFNTLSGLFAREGISLSGYQWLEFSDYQRSNLRLDFLGKALLGVRAAKRYYPELPTWGLVLAYSDTDGYGAAEAASDQILFYRDGVEYARDGSCMLLPDSAQGFPLNYESLSCANATNKLSLTGERAVKSMMVHELTHVFELRHPEVGKAFGQIAGYCNDAACSAPRNPETGPTLYARGAPPWGLPPWMDDLADSVVCTWFGRYSCSYLTVSRYTFIRRGFPVSTATPATSTPEVASQNAAAPSSGEACGDSCVPPGLWINNGLTSCQRNGQTMYCCPPGKYITSGFGYKKCS